MAGKIFGPRKRRTRQHVIADLAVHHVEGFILEEGHTAERIVRDYGYDLVMTTFDERGYVEPDLAYFQIKATDQEDHGVDRYVYDIGIRDYNLWTRERNPVILVLFDAAERRAYWQDIQGYFRNNESRRPKQGAKTVRVILPNNQVISGQAIVAIRQLKILAADFNGA